jgi:hypothetical protein
MADFAVWAVAAEPGLGLRPGQFMEAYCENRDAAHESALEMSPLVKHVFDLADEGNWEGKPSELQEVLDSMATDGEKRLRTWPKSARSLSSMLRKLAPNFRALGIELMSGNVGRDREKRRSISITKTDRGDDGDAKATGDGSVVSPYGTMTGTDGDAGDAKTPLCSTCDEMEVVEI